MPGLSISSHSATSVVFLRVPGANANSRREDFRPISRKRAFPSRRRATMRGLHFQRPPHDEVKIVRCLHGAIFDVIVDLRRESPTFMKWQGFELTADSRRALYVPKGCAHGFLTLADECEVSYLISAFYVSEAAAGYRHNDPAFGIRWPLAIAVISERDSTWPDFDPRAPWG